MNREDPAVPEREREELLTALSTEINRFETFFSRLVTVPVPLAGLLILAGSLILNLIILTRDPQSYLIIWILTSLYFYLIYPLIPLACMLAQALSRHETPTRTRLPPVREIIRMIHPRKNAPFIIRLAVRFFLFGIMPLTWGMIAFYSLSLLFAFILSTSVTISFESLRLIAIQCLGIIIFYLNLWFLRRHYSLFTRVFDAVSATKQAHFLAATAFAVLTILIATGVTIILIVAMLLPGYTTGVYAGDSELIENRTDILIPVLFLSMFIWMQHLQGALSRRIPIRFGSELLSRLTRTRDQLSGPGTVARGDTEPVTGEKARALLAEAAIHTTTMTRLLGLFPVFSIGVDIRELILRWKDLDHADVFAWRRTSEELPK